MRKKKEEENENGKEEVIQWENDVKTRQLTGLLKLFFFFFSQALPCSSVEESLRLDYTPDGEVELRAGSKRNSL